MKIETAGQIGMDIAVVLVLLIATQYSHPLSRPLAAGMGILAFI